MLTARKILSLPTRFELPAHLSLKRKFEYLSRGKMCKKKKKTVEKEISFCVPPPTIRSPGTAIDHSDMGDSLETRDAKGLRYLRNPE